MQFGGIGLEVGQHNVFVSTTKSLLTKIINKKYMNEGCIYSCIRIHLICHLVEHVFVHDDKKKIAGSFYILMEIYVFST